MYVYALLYDYTMTVNLSVYAPCVAQFVIIFHALCVFLTFLGSVSVILSLILFAYDVIPILF